MVYDTSNKFSLLLEKDENSIDYLARIILLNSSPVLLGDKPACIITFSNSDSNKNTLELWNRYKEIIIRTSRLKFYGLHNTNSFTVMLLYDKKKLSLQLEDREVKDFLCSLGYRIDSSVEEKLLIIKQKFKEDIPHEIGIFLGIPLKDVLGFIGVNDLPRLCSMGWIIYGSLEPSISLYKHYRNCKTSMIEMLLNSSSPMEILHDYPV